MQAASEAQKRELSITASRLEAQVGEGVGGGVAWGRSTMPVPRAWTHGVPTSMELAAQLYQ